MQLSEIKTMLQGFAETRVLVVGDVMLDRYVFGEVERISPEAPVPVVKVVREETRLGGAANVANNLVGLGCGVNIASFVGDDEPGDVVRALLKEKLSISGLRIFSRRTTTSKTRYLTSQQQILRTDCEDCSPLHLIQENLFLNYTLPKLPKTHVVLLSDYAKGVLTARITRKIIHLCRRLNVPVVVDPKGDDFSRYVGATLITPNIKEAEIATGMKLTSLESLNEAAKKLQNLLPGTAILITRGKDGMSLFNGDELVHYPARAREVFDVSGAGDTVLACMGAGVGAGFSLRESAALANMAAGIVVGKVGTAVVRSAELLRQLGADHRGNDGKIVLRETLAELLLGPVMHKKEIVFVNGCFDLLHVGHVKYLQKARQLGDLLVLGLNSDASVRRLKGDKRPVLKQSERAQVLAALDCVDYVTVFDEDTPLELIKLVRPMVLAKGADYQGMDVIGRAEVERYGGRLALIDFEEGCSTSTIIDEVVSRYGG